MNNLTNTLLQLLRAALEPTVSPPSIPRLTEEDWNRLFTLAAQHGVTALLFDTILRLPEQQQPSRALKIRWALSSEAIEKRHAQQTRAAHELTTLFASHGVRTILLKGLGLSIYYPPAGAPRMRRHRSVAQRLRQGQPFDRRAGD